MQFLRSLLRRGDKDTALLGMAKNELKRMETELSKLQQVCLLRP